VSYYQKVMQTGETLRYSGRLHWIIYRTPLIMCLLGVASGVVYIGAADNDQRNGWLIASVLLFLAALLTFLPVWFQRLTTEIVVTNRRVIYKRGWISRRTEEMNVSKIETVDVNQSVLGRILGYGNVSIRGVGSSWEPLSQIASPIDLRNAVLVE
jgi:uncharacterized membrane protein YdbT with pleckstrin-like domain